MARLPATVSQSGCPGTPRRGSRPLGGGAESWIDGRARPGLSPRGCSAWDSSLSPLDVCYKRAGYGKERHVGD
jgi:hypothetical protein